MERKDLMLLLSIPLILASLVFYLEPSITGAPLVQEAQTKVVGTYSVIPSFKASFQYDLQDYAKVKQSLDSIIRCAEQGEDVSSCVSSENNNDFEWSLGCDTAPEKVLYELSELLQDCIDSDDSNCVCRKDMEISKDEILKYSLSKKELRLATSNDIQSRKLSIKVAQPKIGLKHDVKTNGVSVWAPDLYIITYAEDKLIGVNMFFTDELQGERRALGPLKELVLYKDKANDIDVINFVKQEGNNLIYPNNEAKKLDNVRLCNLKPKNIQRFCVVERNFRITAYDPVDNAVKERHLVIKLASYIPDSAPLPLKNVEAYDAPKAEKHVIARWEKSPAKDIAKYRIYYADHQLGAFEKTTEELRKSFDVFVQEIDPSAYEELEDSIIPNGCEFDYQKKQCIFSSAGGATRLIEKSKLYYSKADNSYMYILAVPEDKPYDIGVTAVDKANNEINNADFKIPVVKNIKSIDDLPPDSSFQYSPAYDAQSRQVTFNLLEASLKNIDGSKLEPKDIKEYRVYYKKYSKLATLEEELIAGDKLRDSKLGELKQSQILESVQSIIKIDVSAENPQESDVFFFVVIAADVNSNPQEEQFTVKELGAVPAKIII